MKLPFTPVSFTFPRYRYNYNWRILLLVLMWLGTQIASQAQWQTAVSNTTDYLYDVNYGGSQWVAVGDKGTILTSVDGVTWITTISGTTQRLYGVGYGGGQWIAVGANGTILTSSDGTTWASAVSSTTQTLNDVSYGGGKWVAVGEGGTILTSSNSVDWSAQITYPADLFSAVSYGSGRWVAVRSGGFAGGGPLVTSLDGITWTPIMAPVPKKNICQCFYYAIYDVNYSGGRWLAVGEGGLIITSIDGVTWIKGDLIRIQNQYNLDFLSVSYGEGNWLAVGGINAQSTDGINWKEIASKTIPYINSIGYGDTKFVGVGYNGTITYNSAAVLPVSLVAFQVMAESNTAHLSWETAWEKAASHFVIERSRDAKSFESIGRLQAQGTTNSHQQYSFLDEALASGLWYYRLRQVDLDGTFTYSRIIAVRIGTEPLETLTLSPNPGSGPIVLEYKAGIQSVSISSLTGVVMRQQHFEQAVERWNWESAGQPTGMYLIRVQTQDGNSQTLRWVKQ